MWFEAFTLKLNKTWVPSAVPRSSTVLCHYTDGTTLQVLLLAKLPFTIYRTESQIKFIHIQQMLITYIMT